MDTRIQLQPAYILHRQPFQNTSLLIDFFCLDYGRVRAVAKGARREKARHRSLLQLFQPLLISFSGRGEVKTVTGIESGIEAIRLQGRRLFSGMYINELLVRLLLNHEEHKTLYKLYQDTLLALQGERDMEPILRQFELRLLSELGYGINLDADCESHLPITVGASYRFNPAVGFRQSEPDTPQQAADYFRGEDLLALRDMRLQDDGCARAAKRLLRQALAAHLGERPLNSRNLFSVKP